MERQRNDLMPPEDNNALAGLSLFCSNIHIPTFSSDILNNDVELVTVYYLYLEHVKYISTTTRRRPRAGLSIELSAQLK